MRLGSPPPNTEKTANKRLAQIRGATAKTPEDITAGKLVKLKSLSDAYLKQVNSAGSQDLPKAKRILLENTNNDAAIEKLRTTKSDNKDEQNNSTNLLELTISKVNAKFGDSYSEDSISSLTSVEKESFIDKALSLQKAESSTYREAASQYDTDNQGDNFLQEAAMANDELRKATIDLISELKSDSETLDLFLQDGSLISESLGILTHFNRFNQSIAMDTQSQNVQTEINEFLESTKVKAKNDEIRLSYDGLTRVNSISADEANIDTILSTKSDKTLLETIQNLAAAHSGEVGYDSGFHYIQSNAFRDKVKSAYGNGIFAEMRASSLQRRIQETLKGIGNPKLGFKTNIDNYNDNDLNPATLQAYEYFIKAQKDATRNGLNEKLDKTREQLAALKQDHPEQVTIKNEFTTELGTSADNLLELIEPEASTTGRTNLFSLLDKLINHILKRDALELTAKNSTDARDHEILDVMDNASALFLNNLNQHFKELNDRNANGDGNHDVMNIMHDRILDYLLPDAETDPTNQNSVLDDLKEKLMRSVINRELASGNITDPDQITRLEQIRDQGNLSDLKNDYGDTLFKELSNLYADAIQDLYTVAGMPHNSIQRETIEERLKNSNIHDDQSFYDLTNNAFNRISFTGE